MIRSASIEIILRVSLMLFLSQMLVMLGLWFRLSLQQTSAVIPFHHWSRVYPSARHLPDCFSEQLLPNRLAGIPLIPLANITAKSLDWMKLFIGGGKSIIAGRGMITRAKWLSSKAFRTEQYLVKCCVIIF